MADADGEMPMMEEIACLKSLSLVIGGIGQYVDVADVG
jgi:hypothetical protein